MTRDAWLAAERSRFALWLPVCMAVGILAYFARMTEPPPWLGAMWLVAGALVAWCLWRHWMGRAAGLALAFSGLGFAAATLATARAPPWPGLPRTAVIVQGQVTEIEPLPAGRRITLAAPSLDGGAPIARALRIRLRDTDPAEMAPGDTVSVRALVQLPAPPAYPGGWDTQRDAFFTGIGGYGFALGPATIVAAAPSRGVAVWWQGVREGIASRVIAALPGPRGAIAATLLTGRQGAIPPADRAAFQQSGLAHLLAVAGLHVGIVMGLAYAVTRRTLLLSERAALFLPVPRITAVAALAAGGFYLLLTGGHIPILRSFVMASLVTLGLLTGRRAASLRALALAATTLMLVAPWQVMGVSFQMSFAAVLALIAGYESVRGLRIALLTRGFWGRVALYVGGLGFTSLLAGTASAPFAAYHFGTASLWFVPANMLAVPITAFWVLPWGLVSLALMPLHLEALALTPMGWGIVWLLGIAHAVAAWPGATLFVRPMPPWGIAAIAFGIAWLCLWRSRPRGLGLLSIAAGLVSPWLMASPDAFVAADGRVVAARIAGQIWVAEKSGASAFERAAPLRLWGVASATGDPAAMTCDPATCRVALGNQTIALDRAASPDGAATLRLTDTGVIRRTDRDTRGNRPWVLLGRAIPHRAPALPPAATE